MRTIFVSIGFRRETVSTRTKQRSLHFRTLADSIHHEIMTRHVRQRVSHMLRPRSNQFVNRHAPWPSCQMILIRSPRRPLKT
jgi:hypothetical protein